MAKIALDLERALERRHRHGEPGQAVPRVLARGDGWTVSDVLCTSGPQDRPFEERHTLHSIAVVLCGSFQYRSDAGRALMTPGSVLLGRANRGFECDHVHAEGDRCVSFWYAPEYFERIVRDAGRARAAATFALPRIPPVRELAPLVAAASHGVTVAGSVSWEELGVALAARASALAAGRSACGALPRSAEARVTRVVRRIERDPDAALSLAAMAREAGLSPYHFLRSFQRSTGVTPHQYLLRTRLREAAARLQAREQKVVDIALECGFGDVSNFNRAFRAEFGRSPLAYGPAATSGLAEGP